MDYITSIMPTMLTIKETAKKSGIAEYYIRRLVAEQKIVFVKAGKKYLVNFEKFAEFLNHGEQDKDKLIEEKPKGLRPVPADVTKILYGRR